MRIVSWNVNSLKPRHDRFLRFLDRWQPDVVCLQETKSLVEDLPKEAIESAGWHLAAVGQKTYNGVALVSRHSLEDVRLGFTGELTADLQTEELSQQKRVISALVDGIRVINLYVPNGSSLKSEKYRYKLQWLSCLERYLRATQLRDEPLCVVGDFNIGPEARDLHDPDRLSGGIMASDAERDALSQALGDDLKDAFRLFESGSGHWSWWDYRSGAWNRDSGWRIDHIYLSSDLQELALSCKIDKRERDREQPSDHAPVIVDLSWELEDESGDDDESFVAD